MQSSLINGIFKLRDLFEGFVEMVFSLKTAIHDISVT